MSHWEKCLKNSTKDTANKDMSVWDNVSVKKKAKKEPCTANQLAGFNVILTINKNRLYSKKKDFSMIHEN